MCIERKSPFPNKFLIVDCFSGHISSNHKIQTEHDVLFVSLIVIRESILIVRVNNNNHFKCFANLRYFCFSSFFLSFSFPSYGSEQSGWGVSALETEFSYTYLRTQLF